MKKKCHQEESSSSNVKNFILLSSYSINYPHILCQKRRPRWPSGKVSAQGLEGSKFETRLHCRSVVYGACCTPNHTQRAKSPPAGAVRKFGEGVPAQASSSPSCRGSKLRGPSQNRFRIASKQDVNVTKFGRKLYEVVAPKSGTIKVHVQGDLDNAEKKAIFLTVHDIGSNHSSFYTFVNHPSMSEIKQRSVFIHVDVPGQEDHAPDLPNDFVFPTIQTIGEELVAVLDHLKVKLVVGFGEGAGANVLVRFAGWKSHPDLARSLTVKSERPKLHDSNSDTEAGVLTAITGHGPTLLKEVRPIIGVDVTTPHLAIPSRNREPAYLSSGF
ncbi:Uncharacterized protein ZK1073.1 [Araneus ventricosus]|uniref:Uncharacterized protein ZK1073.1 n=1 Tax=Araneus ventricosus TaxID=182803 RepID=A0A4Y2DX02_ARAVE|nr:Uncharacterized protein ZK1073.1 [Araneus ventricosus]